MNLLSIKVELESLRNHPEQDLEIFEASARLLRAANEISLNAGHSFEIVGEFCTPAIALLLVNRLISDLGPQREMPFTEPPVGTTTPTAAAAMGRVSAPSVDIAQMISDQVKAAMDYASSRVSRAELAKLTGVSQRTIDRKTADGTLTAYRVGRRVTYDRNEALKALSNGNHQNSR